MMKKFFDFVWQCQQLQLEKPLGIEFERLIHKGLAINLLKGWAKRTPLPPGLIGLK